VVVNVIEVKNSNSDNFFRKIYTNKLLWFSLQVFLGAIPAIYLIQDPTQFVKIAISSVISNPINFQTLGNVFEAIVFILRVVTFLMLIFFFLIHKSLYTLRDQIFGFSLLLIFPHSWTVSNPIFPHPFQNPILNFLLYASPCIIVGFNLHKSKTEKILEVSP
jgi:hypothetical protein